MKIKFKNIDKVKRRNNARKKDLDQIVKRATTRSALLVKAYAQEQIQRGVATGNPRPDGSIASGPGEFPKTDTGNLVNNISTQTKTEGTTVIGMIISSAEYSKHLEFGTRNMAARPFMQPSLDRNANKIKGIFVKEGLIKKRGRN